MVLINIPDVIIKFRKKNLEGQKAEGDFEVIKVKKSCLCRFLHQTKLF